MKIAVVDGQGGGIGKVITGQIRKELPPETEIIALGTNAIATSLMLKAGANEGASGENAVIQSVKDVDLIVGSLGIILAHSMQGELTPGMAEAIAKSRAKKILLPLTPVQVKVVGMEEEAETEPLNHLVARLVARLKEIAERATGGL
ncbi:MAG: DUF3842 family protein [Bacillota bacterium]|nr:DUF3842 family protein [Bacillota bacterium]